MVNAAVKCLFFVCRLALLLIKILHLGCFYVKRALDYSVFVLTKIEKNVLKMEISSPLSDAADDNSEPRDVNVGDSGRCRKMTKIKLRRGASRRVCLRPSIRVSYGIASSK